MITVSELIKWYNKQKSTQYHKIKVQDPNEGNFSIHIFTDVSEVSKKDGILSFYGRAEPPKTYDSSVPKQNQIRFTRINDVVIIYSEV